MGRVVVQQPQGWPTIGSVCARTTPGRRAGRTRAQGRDDEQIEQPIQHGFLPEVVLADLVGEQRNHGQSQSAARSRPGGQGVVSRRLISPSSWYVPSA